MIDAVRKRWKLSVCLILLVFALSVSSAFAQSEVILRSDFENGIQNWEVRGAKVSIKSDKEQAASGTKSLKVGGRSANWNGAQLNLTKSLSGGKAYKFSVSVKLAKGETADDVRMTMQWGDNDYSTVGNTNASATEWTTFSGKFAPKGNESFLTIYVEAARANTVYYIDDFKIEPAGDDIPAQSGILLQNDFEDRTAQNWNTYGDGVQMFSSNASGSQSLKVTGRTANWQGVALDISPMFFKGRTYLISVSAKLLKGQPSDSLKLTMKQTPPKGEPSYMPITNLTTVTDSDWVTLSGEYKVTTSGNNLLIYVETTSATTSFYIDNFVVKIP